MDWKLADAKNRFSELVNRALSDGPQRVTRRKDTVVILSETDYRKLTGKQPAFKQYLMDGPDLEGINLQRDHSPMRDVRP